MHIVGGPDFYEQWIRVRMRYSGIPTCGQENSLQQGIAGCEFHRLWLSHRHMAVFRIYI
jgi:hypothetical protein